MLPGTNNSSDRFVRASFYVDALPKNASHQMALAGVFGVINNCNLYAPGDEIKYFDHHSVVGFTRTGDTEHPNSGLAVLVTDSVAGENRMYVGKQFAGQKFYDALGNIEAPVDIDTEGHGNFKVDGGSVSVWVTKEAYNKIWTEAK